MSVAGSICQVEPIPSKMCPSCGNTTVIKRLFYNRESDVFFCLKCGWRKFL
ncbi:MAG: hypothetical protein GXO65_06680 [Euryarchaeota archaeon]|nr:hypothetical protein [Euryarchaeota archaeon]